MRVHELAKELGVASKELLASLKEMGIDGLTASSSVPDQAVPRLRASGGKAVPEAKIKEAVEEPLPASRPRKRKEVLEPETPPAAPKPAPVAEAEPPTPAAEAPPSVEPPPAPEPAGPSLPALKLVHGSTPQDVADKTGRGVAEIVKTLFSLGEMATASQSLSDEALGLLAAELGFEAEVVGVDEEEEPEEEVDESRLEPRAPVVTIMGHVDHGKTLLLDAIRRTDVVSQEFGGITQHIGAYQVHTNGREVTFIDTPGHEAFTAMRARGAQVTDIAVLVVAADDGVKPQTIEALDHAKAAGVQVLVAVNKIDKPGAQPDRIRQQLSDHGLNPEEWGGQTLYANVSAKKKIGIQELIEIVLLQADVLDLKGNPAKFARGTVIESRLEKGRGPVATVLVADGTLKVGDAIVTGIHYGRVRSLLNHKGKRLNEAPPGTPVEIQGLSGLPDAGQKFAVLKDERTARQIALHRGEKERERAVVRPRMSLEDLHKQIDEGLVKELNIVIKSDVQGSMEALRFSLDKLADVKVKVAVIHSGVGGISESDVMLASASSAVIIGFNVRPEPKAAVVAEREGVDIRLYSVIYDVVDDVKKAMEGLLDPTLKEVVMGRAEVRNMFHISKIGTIAGCSVLSGKIARGANIRLLRDSVVVFEGKLSSLKRFKDDVKEVAEGYECGLGIDGYNDLQVGDHIEAFVIEKIAGTLA